ncbi:Periplasmic Sensor Signal Transduction Histidine Kinase [Trichormus variabilis ATCC 29413]|uniref:histidine kinase n=2 Tax=Anabaena variabilis TaxID=264691 RepID=Q3MAA5_TRIV2|nr:MULTISPECIES: ATP-binding protein [Nostocaceae]ABA22081.1 Periplasmic Sensor Signal Transduction Histidine Kinase [Trichormus variabilis ATCC 29413]MBC1216830.1 HAMP domain-containing protein [Trichormus variabilis ARAD]MBC1258081.1 HAMP domain-containing protein [Trichormus variabilis V5]MBC1269641.1 HAMP domain-containing protein [Trichormus variabilis FSR]MBC1304027.1 HAMP domain-containing protein [Trichormus variabilis N2B]
MQRFFRQLNLSQKIVIPLLIVYLSVFLLGLVVTGHWFTESLEQNFRQDVNNFTERVYQDFQYEQKTLETEIKLISYQDKLRRAIEERDQDLLLQILLPLRTVLGLDWLKVVDPQGNVLTDLRSNSLSQVRLLDKLISSSASSGAQLTDLVDTEDGTQVIQTVTYGIKSATGLLGGIIIGNSVDNTLLRKIATGSSKHLITQKNNRIVATTLLAAQQGNWQFPTPDMPVKQIMVNKHNYLAKSILFSGTTQALTTTVLYSTSVLKASQWKLWQHLGFLYVLGSVIVAIAGFLTTRTITRPLQAVTQVAQRVTQDSNFNLQASVNTEDEVGILAISLNQLIKQVKLLLAEQYEGQKKLEAYNQTLEQRVEERTQALQQKNISLRNTLQELKLTQTQLIQHEKMSSLGQLVAGIAHEINNPVNFIYGNLNYTDEYIQQLLNLFQLYQKYYPNPELEIQEAQEDAEIEYVIEDLPKILASMKIGASRIREIVLSLRIFSRLDEAEFKTADLHEGIDSTLLILQHRIKSQTIKAMTYGRQNTITDNLNKKEIVDKHRPQLEIVKEYGDIPKIPCFAGQMNQVFMNILANAIDALEEAFYDGLCPEPTIHITSWQVDESVVIAIADNGRGIPQEVQSRLFDPFFTTKPVGKGTGMGLSISYQIITEKHGGTLQCISSSGQGTKFVITIPIRLAD